MDSVKNFFRQYPNVAVTILVLTIGLVSSLFVVPELWIRILFTIWGAVVAIQLSKEMLETLKSGRYGVDLVAIVAIASTLILGEYWASMIIVLMLTGGEALEAYAAKRAKRELSALLERAPKIAHLKSGEDIPINDVKVGDVLLVKPQEIIPVNGTLEDNLAIIDESSLTGESAPVEYAKGAELLSGSVNGDHAIIIKATKTAEESEYQQIIKLVEAAGSTDSPFVRLADRYAVPFTIISFAIAGAAWWISGDPVRLAQVLVVATPCPLILATPIALISGMSRAAKQGIIIKSSAVLEKLSQIKSAAFDKTGTLTYGSLEISQIRPAQGVDENELLKNAAAAEQQSSHIIAEAILKEAKDRGVSIEKPEKTTDTPAFGVEAKVAGSTILAGKLEFLQNNDVKNIPEKSDEPLAGTLVFVAKDGDYQGVIELQDKIRENAAETIQNIKDQNVSEIFMLTGDNQTVAKSVADKLKITNFKAHCLPADKVKAVKSQEVQKPVMMVGDGVNDAPVLAAADVGVAMGAKGSTAASETADMVIMLDDISRVASAIGISKRTMHIAKESILIGIGLSIGLMIIAAFGYIPTVVGALLQEVVDIVVIVNALRALR